MQPLVVRVLVASTARLYFMAKHLKLLEVTRGHLPCHQVASCLEVPHRLVCPLAFCAWFSFLPSLLFRSSRLGFELTPRFFLSFARRALCAAAFAFLSSLLLIISPPRFYIMPHVRAGRNGTMPRSDAGTGSARASLHLFQLIAAPGCTVLGFNRNICIQIRLALDMQLWST